VIERARGRCERCGSRLDVEVHHRDAIAEGGPEIAKLGRMVALCRTCHVETFGT
jgi:5-methylcytosine-specific restriction endonuclease McrA